MSPSNQAEISPARRASQEKIAKIRDSEAEYLSKLYGIELTEQCHAGGVTRYLATWNENHAGIVDPDPATAIIRAATVIRATS